MQPYVNRNHLSTSKRHRHPKALEPSLGLPSSSSAYMELHIATTLEDHQRRTKPEESRRACPCSLAGTMPSWGSAVPGGPKCGVPRYPLPQCINAERGAHDRNRSDTLRYRAGVFSHLPSLRDDDGQLWRIPWPAPSKIRQPVHSLKDQPMGSFASLCA
jgi:hypothetical protein